MLRAQATRLPDPAPEVRLAAPAGHDEERPPLSEPRNDATRSAIRTSRRDGPSCWMEVGSHTFHAVSVSPPQNSSRPS